MVIGDQITPYSTDRGEIVIAKTGYGIMVGDKAYFNNKAAPNGRYRLSWMNYIYIKNGVVVRTWKGISIYG